MLNSIDSFNISTSIFLIYFLIIILGCLVASVSVASSPVTSDEIETISIEIVENSLELFNTILTTIRQSTRAGGHVLQNYIMMGAWVLTSGLLVQLASAMETSPTTTKPRLPLADLMSHGLNLNKVQQRLVLRFNNRWRWRRARSNFRQRTLQLDYQRSLFCLYFLP